MNARKPKLNRNQFEIVMDTSKEGDEFLAVVTYSYTPAGAKASLWEPAEHAEVEIESVINTETGLDVQAQLNEGRMDNLIEHALEQEGDREDDRSYDD